ncbi:hypothetical protein TNCV_797781 [Trichonephila clavipes]|nr:hypothetical protein TNCV_797781 [Trichonephila clavipes]
MAGSRVLTTWLPMKVHAGMNCHVRGVPPWTPADRVWEKGFIPSPSLPNPCALRGKSRFPNLIRMHFWREMCATVRSPPCAEELRDVERFARCSLDGASREVNLDVPLSQLHLATLWQGVGHPWSRVTESVKCRSVLCPSHSEVTRKRLIISNLSRV